MNDSILGIWEKVWRKGDYISYRLCHWGHNDCQEFQMDMWVEGPVILGTESRWAAQVRITDEDYGQLQGSMEVGTDSAEPFGRDDATKPFREAFGSSVAWMALSTSETSPGNLALGEFLEYDKWILRGIIPQTFSVVDLQRITVPAGSFDISVLQSDTTPQNKIWIADGIPFPVKAIVYLDRVCDSGCPLEYEFELLKYSKNMTYVDFIEEAGKPSENYPSPLTQFKSGIQYHETKCNSNMQLTQKYDGSPACVSPETYLELIKRGWVSNIILTIQSRDVFIDPEDALSSYMGKITPTLDDFKNVLSEPYDIDEIFSKFGEPHDDIGSGIHIYVYELNDNTEIWIGYVDDIWYVKHIDAGGNKLEDLFVKDSETASETEKREIPITRESFLELEFGGDAITVFITDRTNHSAISMDLSTVSQEWTVVPISSLVEAHDKLPKTSSDDRRGPGTMVSDTVKAGTYIKQNGEKEFWYTIGGIESQVITIELQDHKYDRITFVSDKNHEWIEQINEVVNSRK